MDRSKKKASLWFLLISFFHCQRFYSPPPIPDRESSVAPGNHDQASVENVKWQSINVELCATQNYYYF